MDATAAASAQSTFHLSHYRRKYFGPLLLLLLSLRMLTTAVWLALLLRYPMDLSFPEGAVVARAFDVSRGESAYQNWREWPHAFAPYGPLTYYPVGWFAALTGLSIHPMNIYTIGRIQSLAALLGLVIVIVLVLRRLGCSRAWPSVGVAAFLAWDAPITFTASYRPDAPQVFFALLALWIALGGSAHGARLWGGLICLSASMWFKPMSWGMLVALGYWIASSAGIRKFLISMSVFGLLNLGLACALNWLWDGRLFLNMVGSLDNGWRERNLLEFYQSLLERPTAAFIFCVGVAYPLTRLLKRGDADRERVFLVAVVAAFLFATAQNLKVGADVNYYLEFLALASVALGMWLSRLWNHGLRFPQAGQEALLWLIVLPVALYDARALRSVRYELSQIVNLDPPLVKIVKPAEGPILTAFPYLSLERPSPATIMDQVQYTILAERGKLSDGPLLERLRRREFSLVIIPPEQLEIGANAENMYSPRFVPILLQNYTVEKVTWKMAVLRPISAPAKKIE